MGLIFKINISMVLEVKTGYRISPNTYLTRVLLLVILSNVLSMADFIRPVRFNLQRWQSKSKLRVKDTHYTHL